MVLGAGHIQIITLTDLIIRTVSKTSSYLYAARASGAKYAESFAFTLYSYLRQQSDDPLIALSLRIESNSPPLENSLWNLNPR